jgi:hypothetical protein
MALKFKGEIQVEKGLGLPLSTTADRLAYAPPQSGYKVWDTDLNKEFNWDGSVWAAVGGASGGLPQSGILPASIPSQGIYTAQGTNVATTLYAATGSQDRVMVSSTVTHGGTVISVQAGEYLNGVLNGTYTTQADGELLLFLDNGAGLWTVQVNSTQAGLASVYGELALPNGQNIGTALVDLSASSFTLPDAGVYDISYHVYFTHNIGGTSTSVGMYDASNVLVPQSQAFGASVSGSGQSPMITNTVRITTSASATYKLKMVTNTGNAVIVNNGTGTTSSANSKITYNKISGFIPSIAQPLSYVSVSAGAAQTTFNASSPVLFSNPTIAGDIPFSSGIFNLSAGKTYNISAHLGRIKFSTSGGYIFFSWRDLGTATYIGSRQMISPETGGANVSISNSIETIYTPAVDTTIQLEIGLSSAVISIGEAANIIYPSAKVIQIGSVGIDPTLLTPESLTAVTLTNSSTNTFTALTYSGKQLIPFDVATSIRGLSPNANGTVTLPAGTHKADWSFSRMSGASNLTGGVGVWDFTNGVPLTQFPESNEPSAVGGVRNEKTMSDEFTITTPIEVGLVFNNAATGTTWASSNNEISTTVGTTWLKLTQLPAYTIVAVDPTLSTPVNLDFIQVELSADTVTVVDGSSNRTVFDTVSNAGNGAFSLNADGTVTLTAGGRYKINAYAYTASAANAVIYDFTNDTALSGYTAGSASTEQSGSLVTIVSPTVDINVGLGFAASETPQGSVIATGRASMLVESIPAASIVAVDPTLLNLANGVSTLGLDHDVAATGGLDVLEDTTLSVTVPSAGRWLIQSNAIGTVGNGSDDGMGVAVAITDSANVIINDGGRTVLFSGWDSASASATSTVEGSAQPFAYVTTTAAATFKLRVSQGNNIPANVLKAATTLRYEQLPVSTVVSLIPTGQSVDYVNVMLTGGIQSVANNAAILFNTTNAGNIPYNPVTGQFTLSAGKTYSLRGMIANQGGTTYTNSQWFNVTSSTLIGSLGQSIQDTQTSGFSSTLGAEIVITPSVTTIVALRNTSGGTTSAGGIGRSFATITQLGSTAVVAGSPKYEVVTTAVPTASTVDFYQDPYIAMRINLVSGFSTPQIKSINGATYLAVSGQYTSSVDDDNFNIQSFTTAGSNGGTTGFRKSVATAGVYYPTTSSVSIGTDSDDRYVYYIAAGAGLSNYQYRLTIMGVSLSSVWRIMVERFAGTSTVSTVTLN